MLERITRAIVRREGRDMIGLVEWRDRHGRIGRVAASLGNADIQAHLQQAEREGIPIEREDRHG